MEGILQGLLVGDAALPGSKAVTDKYPLTRPRLPIPQVP